MEKPEFAILSFRLSSKGTLKLRKIGVRFVRLDIMAIRAWLLMIFNLAKCWVTVLLFVSSASFWKSSKKETPFWKLSELSADNWMLSKESFGPSAFRFGRYFSSHLKTASVTNIEMKTTVDQSHHLFSSPTTVPVHRGSSWIRVYRMKAL